MDKNDRANNKVLNFPLKAGRMMKLNKEQRKMVLTGSLASVLLMAIFINETIQGLANSAKNNISGRGIASVSDDGDYLRDREWEHQLASRLSNQPVAPVNQLDIASSAITSANSAELDQMAFVDLEGKYSLRLENGKVREIEFAQSGTENDRPKHINAMEFMNQHKQLWSVSFHQIEPSGSGGFILKNEKQAAVGRAQASFDERGRLVGLKLESL